MHDLGRLVARGITGKEPLPAPFPEWGKRGHLLYPGSTHLYAGVAGTFKTMVTTATIVNMGVPTLTFSTDSDDLTMASRLLSLATGRPTVEMRLMALRNPEGAAQILSDRYGYIKWSFKTDPDGDDIWHNLYAYATRYGAYPRLVVADILSDVVFTDAESEWAALRITMKNFNIIARETDAAVLLVHHATEGVKTSDMNPCPGRDAIMGKDSKHPVLVMTFGKDSQDDLHAACVKARHGKADMTGRSSFRMSVDPTTSWVGDYDPARRPSLQLANRWQGWAPGGGEDDDDG